MFSFRFISILIFISTICLAQNNSIYYPPNFKEAIKNGTRNYDGKPGGNYWINKSEYVIKANIDVNSRTLYGSEKIKFKNNSPDILNTIVVRLYQEFFKKGNSRDFQIPSNATTDGMKISKVLINGEKFEVGKSNEAVINGTNMFINLKRDLPPDGSINIEIDWNFKIPKIVNLRMGTYDESSFFIGHWYPQIAVYDDIDGWDFGNYNGMLEFYNDFHNFDVEITMPKDFIVWATGELQNPKETFSEKIYNRYKVAKYSDSVVPIIDSNDVKDKNFTVDKEKVVWKYKASDVPDFAFATSDHYLWDMCSIQITDNDKRVMVGAAYKKESKDFYEVAEISRKSIIYFSDVMPGINYPWPSMLVFNGHGGMEFPMMVNDGSMSARSYTLGVTSHEIAHTYFPFYMGTSERKYAFMDEGWAVMLPFDFQKEEGKYNAVARQVDGYEKFAGTEYDLPLTIASSAASTVPYRQMVYRRAGLAYWFLKDAVGEKKFKNALREYVSRWAGKHPSPFDFYHTFENVINEDLNWFWKPWFFEFGAPDLKVVEVNRVRNSYRIQVDKVGNIPVPIKLKLYFDDGTSVEHYESCNVWNGKDSHISEIQSNKNAVKVILGSPDIPDTDKSNNKLEL